MAVEKAPSDITQVTGDISTVWLSLQNMVHSFLLLLPKLIIAAIVFGLFLLLAKLARRIITRMTRNRTHYMYAGLVLGRISSWIIGIGGFLIAATIALPSVQPVDLLSLLGIGGVAFGFAFKDVLQNFLAGILILLRRPFEIGDTIVFGDYDGTVIDIETRATHLKTPDGRLAIIPNGEIFVNSLLVSTAYPERRSHSNILIGYDNNLPEVMRILYQAISSVEEVLESPAPLVSIEQMAELGITLRLEWWTVSKGVNLTAVRGKVLYAVREALTAARVHTPYSIQLGITAEQAKPA